MISSSTVCERESDVYGVTSWNCSDIFKCEFGNLWHTEGHRYRCHTQILLRGCIFFSPFHLITLETWTVSWGDSLKLDDGITIKQHEISRMLSKEALPLNLSSTRCLVHLYFCLAFLVQMDASILSSGVSVEPDHCVKSSVSVSVQIFIVLKCRLGAACGISPQASGIPNQEKGELRTRWNSPELIT